MNKLVLLSVLSLADVASAAQVADWALCDATNPTACIKTGSKCCTATNPSDKSVTKTVCGPPSFSKVPAGVP